MSHALRLHATPIDVARIMAHSSIDDAEANARIASMRPADGLATLTALLRASAPTAQARALSLASCQWSHIGHTAIVSAFESAGSDRGLLCYLSARMSGTPSDPTLTLAYLKVCRTAGRADEVERVTRDPGVTYEPHAVLELLTDPLGDGAPADPRPIINVCDRFNLAGEMAAIFHAQGRLKHLALYVQKVNPGVAPQVAGGLLDAGAAPGTVASMVSPLDAGDMTKDPTLGVRLIAACEEREQLGLLKPWLEARAEEALDEQAATAVREALQRLKPKGLFSSLMSGK